MDSVLIVGGGLSGLTAAYTLAQAGVSSTVIEPQPELGGLIRTTEVNGCLLEEGPDSFLAAKPCAEELIRELGLGDQLVGSDENRRLTFVVREDELVPLPRGLTLMVPTQLEPVLASPLLSDSAKQQLAACWLQPPRQPPPPQEESVAHFVQRHYGAEMMEYIAEPLLSGVFGGDPALLSAPIVLQRFVELERAYGSVSRGLREEALKRSPAAEARALFLTLRSGLGSWIEALRQQSAPYLRCIQGWAEGIEYAEGNYRVGVNGDWLAASRVLLACPAYVTGKLLRGLDEERARRLGEIPYSSSATLALGYARQDMPELPEGFGVLVPEKERRHLMAATLVDQKWPFRVPADQAVVRCFFGGAHRAAILERSDDELVTIAREEVERLLRVRAVPRFSLLGRWPLSMPQYNLGHAERLRARTELMDRFPGIQIAGNAYYGVGLPDTVRVARECARALL